MTRREPDTILAGCEEHGRILYACRPGPDGNVWTAYDIVADGTLANPRVVFGTEPDLEAGWRGLPVAQ